MPIVNNYYKYWHFTATFFCVFYHSISVIRKKKAIV
ncbi:hypothetical protein IX330_000895 [Bacteroides pyogenes]|nr:hypothetical protein [Bacteroides pyogenes]MBR8792204.1 hypothetical protein [Bacteroides pyogenes]